MPEKTSLQRAVFVDLDGVFFKLVNHFGERGVAARLPHEVRIIGGLSKVLTDLVDLGFVIIGITNQPDIARGKITWEFLDYKHDKLRRKYPQIAAIFICPHTETDLCDCRKPKSGLLLQASEFYNIDLASSWMVGDSRADVEAGDQVDAQTIFIRTEHNCTHFETRAINLATKDVKSTIRALKLIVDLERKATNREDC